MPNRVSRCFEANPHDACTAGPAHSPRGPCAEREVMRAWPGMMTPQSGQPTMCLVCFDVKDRCFGRDGDTRDGGTRSTENRISTSTSPQADRCIGSHRAGNAVVLQHPQERVRAELGAAAGMQAVHWLAALRAAGTEADCAVGDGGLYGRLSRRAWAASSVASQSSPRAVRNRCGQELTECRQSPQCAGM